MNPEEPLALDEAAAVPETADLAVEEAATDPSQLQRKEPSTEM